MLNAVRISLKRTFGLNLLSVLLLFVAAVMIVPRSPLIIFNNTTFLSATKRLRVQTDLPVYFFVVASADDIKVLRVETMPLFLGSSATRMCTIVLGNKTGWMVPRLHDSSPRGKCNYSSAASLRPLIFASDGTIIILAFDARKIRDGNWKSASLGSLVSRMFSGYPYEE
ncbi:hypothetical protein HZH68_012284 [Vespula germanica]|uniref:Uncharacterized protein n=1 Tax=Vespula germanica TaxID=30212 RepID=A0A834JI67_VESGE|nr:hypothetical protein HZH68_012284 [Vespula germanica]